METSRELLLLRYYLTHELSECRERLNFCLVSSQQAIDSLIWHKLNDLYATTFIRRTDRNLVSLSESSLRQSLIQRYWENFQDLSTTNVHPEEAIESELITGAHRTLYRDRLEASRASKPARESTVKYGSSASNHLDWRKWTRETQRLRQWE